MITAAFLLNMLAVICTPNKNTGELSNTPNKIDQLNAADLELDDTNADMKFQKKVETKQ